MTQATKVKIVTGKVRFSYANVFSPKASVEGGTPKYSVSAYFGGSVPKGLKGGLRDGDEEKEDAAYAGSYFINANSAQKPGVVDQDLNPIMDMNEFYSGCYGRASITFYPYNAQGSKGIACGLNNVQKLEDGEKLGGATSAAADFAI